MTQTERDTRLTVERAARNQVIFRDANEPIEEKAEEVGFQEPVPFICECHRADCRELIRLSLSEYEQVRAQAEWFFVVPAHAVTEIDGTPLARKVGEGDGFFIMEKLGVAGEIAREADRRE